MSKITLIKRPALCADQKARGEYIYATKMGQKLPVDKLAKRIAVSGTTVSKADVLAVLNNLGDVIIDEVMHGMAVEIPGLGSIHLFANGVMDKDGNDIAPKGRRYRMKMTFKKALLNLTISTDNLSAELVDFKAKTPKPTRFEDARSGTINTQLTRGKMAALHGKYLRVDLSAEDEGVWLIPETPDDETLRVTDFLDNNPARLSFLIPTELQVGQRYRVEVRNRINGSKHLAIGSLTETLSAVD